jgi:hypothetical protein
MTTKYVTNTPNVCTKKKMKKNEREREREYHILSEVIIFIYIFIYFLFQNNRLSLPLPFNCHCQRNRLRLFSCGTLSLFLYFKFERTEIKRGGWLTVDKNPRVNAKYPLAVISGLATFTALLNISKSSWSRVDLTSFLHFVNCMVSRWHLSFVRYRNVSSTWNKQSQYEIASKWGLLQSIVH